MRILLFILTLLFSLASLEAKQYIILEHPVGDRGFFSVLDHIFGNIYIYNHKKKIHKRYTGLRVNFSNHGYYYDKERGLNWWSYYFEPITIGTIKGKAKIFKKMINDYPLLFLEKTLSKEQVKLMIDQYLLLKPDVQEYINNFVSDYFKDAYIIGIHYRGTDKLCEAPKVEYDEVVKRVKEVIKTAPDNYRIFVATDEKQFIDYMVETFDDLIIYVDACERSEDGRPLHKVNSSPYFSGFYALVDSVLLSKCDFLIRTSSNLSRWSTFFNPEIPVIELNKAYRD